MRCFFKISHIMKQSAKFAAKISVAVLAAIMALSSIAVFSSPAGADVPASARTGSSASTEEMKKWADSACLKTEAGGALAEETVKPTDLNGYITHGEKGDEHYHPRSEPAAKCAVDKVFKIQNIDAILIVVGSGLTLFSAIMVLLKIAGVGKGSMGGGGGKLKWLLFMILGIILTRPTALLIPTIFFGYRIAQSLGDNVGNLLPWA